MVAASLLHARPGVPSSTLDQIAVHALAGILCDHTALRKVAERTGCSIEQLAAGAALDFSLTLHSVLEEHRRQEIKESNARRDELDRAWLAVRWGRL